MRVLFTDFELQSWSGSKIVVRDFALKLAERGHAVSVFSTKPGGSAETLSKLGIRVVTELSEQPDIIHGHHNIPTVLALGRFPTARCVWFCHSRTWPDIPPISNRIYRYVAVDETRFEFLVKEHGIHASRVEIIRNAVNLARIPPRNEPLPSKPRRVLAFSKFAAHIPTLRAACVRLGMTFDAIGKGVERIVYDPEHYLSKSDLVFATDRCAIEAICAGAAVVVGDARGIAGLVTTRNLKAMRNINFGVRSLIHPMSAVKVESEIARYEASDAIAVTERLRPEADLDKSVDRLEQLYADAMRSELPQPDDGGVRFILDHWPVANQLDLWEPERRQLQELARS